MENNTLNTQQQAAVENNNSSMLIVAGAGTGKTRVLVEKIIHLLSAGVAPSEILTLTFTNKAGDEMRERIVRRLGIEARPFIGTFHSFCVSLLREFAEQIGLKKDFVILDADACKKIIKRCMKERGIDDVRPGLLQSLISSVKTQGVLIEEDDALDAIRNTTVRATVQTILPMYKQKLTEEGGVDFDDLLIYTVRLLRGTATVRKAVQERYRYIFVDEFQDTDDVQNELIALLKGKQTLVVAVGDTDQTIYSWRNANVHNLLEFCDQHEGAETFFLTQNYRSTKTILEAANAVIDKNILRQKKELAATRGEGERIQLSCAYDEDEEAMMLAETINQLHRDGVPYREMAVLFRANFQARALEMQCIQHNIPYTVLGARFFDRSEVKNLVAYLMLIQNPYMRSAYERAVSVPGRGIGAQTIEKVFSGNRGSIAPAMRRKVERFEQDIAAISSYAKQHTVAEVLQQLVKQLEYEEFVEKAYENVEDRMQHVAELIAFAKKCTNETGDEALMHFLSEISLGSDQDTLRTHTRRDSVRLMTIHAAKGLEFSHVFIVGMEEGLFPMVREGDGDSNDPEEERRLCYVAMTRAKDGLHCSFVQRRGIFGNYKKMQPSSFLKDIPEHLLSSDERLATQEPEAETESIDTEGEEEIEW